MLDKLEQELEGMVDEVMDFTKNSRGMQVEAPKTELYKAIGVFNKLCVERKIRIEKLSKNSAYAGGKYADLSTINEVILPLLVDSNLIFLASINENTFTAKLIEITSGQYIESTRALNSFHVIKREGKEKLENLTPQEFGSMITYLRRYMLTTLLNLSTDEEDDGNAASGTKPKLTPTEKTLYKGKLSKKEITIEELKEKYNISKDEEKMLLN